VSGANGPAQERAEGDAARKRAKQGGQDESMEEGTQKEAEEATDGQQEAGRTVPVEERPEAGGV